MRRLSSMRQGRNSPAIATLNGKIFAMGGRAPENTVGRLNSVEVYDVKTNQWTAGKPLVRQLIFRPLHRSVIPKTLCLAMLFLFRSSSGLTQLEQLLEGRSMW